MRKGVSKLRLALNQPIKFPKIKKSKYEKIRDDNIKHRMDILASLKLMKTHISTRILSLTKKGRHF